MAASSLWNSKRPVSPEVLRASSPVLQQSHLKDPFEVYSQIPKMLFRSTLRSRISFLGHLCKKVTPWNKAFLNYDGSLFRFLFISEAFPVPGLSPDFSRSNAWNILVNLVRLHHHHQPLYKLISSLSYLCFLYSLFPFGSPFNCLSASYIHSLIPSWCVNSLLIMPICSVF